MDNFEDARKAWKGFKKEEEIGSIYYCCLVRGPSHEAVTYTSYTVNTCDPKTVKPPVL
jgi:hypothetical protein